MLEKMREKVGTSSSSALSLLFRPVLISLVWIISGLVHSSDADYQTLNWEDLVPAEAKSLPKSQPINHDSLLLEAPPQISAPVVGALDRKKVRIPGFAVPLEGNETGVTEFLLVPYMGACIHVPPPPSNQIVYVNAKSKPLSLDMIYDAFWVTGTITVQATTSQYGDTGYSMTAENFELYNEKQE
jgi:hypothetical protein